MAKLNEQDSNNYNLKELETVVVINNDYSSLFPCVDTNGLFIVLVDYVTTGMTSIAPIVSKLDVKCGYVEEEIISVERDCLLVWED